MKKIIMLLLLLISGILTACNNSPTSSDGQLRIGFIHLTDPIKMSYTYNHDQGTRKMIQNLGLKPEQVINKYNVKENEECSTAIEELAAAGCQIIFGSSYGYEEYFIEAARRYPQIQFCHASGVQAKKVNLPNYHNYFAAVYEGRYLTGIAAGLKLRELQEQGLEPKLGFVAGFYYEEVISGFTAFYLGARSVCPEAAMLVTKIDSWSDPAKEAAATQALIDQGCLVICQQSINSTPATTAEANKVYHCGYNGDLSEAAPLASLISTRVDWSIYLTYAVQCMLDGEEIAADWCSGLSDGTICLTPLNTAIAAPGTQEALEQAQAQIVSGELQVFAGP
ncbi:MAG: BMP family ABC transporter substrate-binding protein, partial [Clostridia bacterium]|nr:BMP family ABC transporter substrate-binding protein [Clostridia bacterium]